MTETSNIQLDADGIPLLEERVTPGEPAAVEESVPPPAYDSDRFRQLLQMNGQQMLDDLTEDLQQTVLWKLESILKEEMGRVIQEAIQQSAPRIQQDLHTQLELALPDLLASLVEQNTPRN